MKYTVSLFLVISLLFSVCCFAYAAPGTSAKSMADILQAVAPAEFGYIENTEYAMAHDFSALSCVDDSCVVVCAESTNFNEIGVFHVKNESDIRDCVEILKGYLSARKEQFQNGVIYDINEYPKFENAKVTVAGKYVVYTILDAKATRAVVQALNNNLK